MSDFMVPAAAGDSPQTLERVQRRLQAVGKVLNHDLPNQLVVIQGLVQLLGLEENDRLSADGREYLRRLGGASTRALDMAQGLKTLARLSTAMERPERITLKDLAEEVAVEIKKLFPGTSIVYDFPKTVEVSASRRLLYQALVELVRLSFSLGGTLLVQMDSERTADGVTITIGPGGARPTAASSPAVRAAADGGVCESRLEYMLARELVDVAGGRLSWFDAPGGSRCFSILVSAAGVPSGDEGAAL
jgi:light-regulated signal transduction histidine kinase (bacteriophytochrome)